MNEATLRRRRFATSLIAIINALSTWLFSPCAKPYSAPRRRHHRFAQLLIAAVIDMGRQKGRFVAQQLTPIVEIYYSHKVIQIASIIDMASCRPTKRNGTSTTCANRVHPRQRPRLYSHIHERVECTGKRCKHESARRHYMLDAARGCKCASPCDSSAVE